MVVKYVKMGSVENNVLNIMDVLSLDLFIVEVEFVLNSISIVQDMICVH